MQRITYNVMREHLGDAPIVREVDVDATPEELESLDRDGYLVRERVIEGEWLESLRSAIDRMAEAEWPEIRPYSEDNLPERTWGAILRHLLDKDATFHELIAWPPALSVARAMMGPLVRVRGMHARITFAGEEPQDIPWHQHLRVVSEPLPRWFSQPHAIDCLIYLDELSDETGALSVIPGSHRWLDREPPRLRYESLPDEQKLRIPAGSMVIIHANLWHRALSTLQGKRRMIILSYTPCWLRESPHGGPPPKDGLTRDLAVEGDREIRELLGLVGFT